MKVKHINSQINIKFQTKSIENSSKDVPLRRVKRWGFDLRELLNDPIGHDQFTKFLEKEYSGENLK